jgi:hypothetical protein
MNIPNDPTTAGTCDGKCIFSFNYPTSNTCNVKNIEGKYFQLRYETPKFSVICYEVEYVARYVDICFPSRHLFNDNFVKGEIVIYHDAEGYKELYICIPFDNQIDAPQSNLLNNILNEIYSYHVINDNQQYQLSLDQDYNLNSFVKYEPYYYYENGDNEKYMVYGLDKGFSVSTNLITSIMNLLPNAFDSRYSDAYPTKTGLSFNKNGPTNSDGDDIYIDCQPVDEEGNLLIDKYDNKNFNIGGNKSAMTTVILNICGAVMLLFAMFLFIWIFYKNKNKNNINNLNNQTNILNPPGMNTTLPTSFTIATRTLLRALGVT